MCEKKINKEARNIRGRGSKILSFQHFFNLKRIAKVMKWSMGILVRRTTANAVINLMRTIFIAAYSLLIILPRVTKHPKIKRLLKSIPTASLAELMKQLK
jgi:hypothetical protein